MPKRKIHVVLDTSAIHSTGIDSVLAQPVLSAIDTYASHADAEVRWYVPRMVVMERAFQLLVEGKEAQGKVGRLERITGQRPEVLDWDLRALVDAHIAETLQRLGLTVLELAADSVNWDRIMHDAAMRIPPFETGKSEKGFRDVVILETFVTFHSQQQSDTTDLLVLVSGDGLLRQAAEDRLRTSGNVRFLRSVDDLSNLVSAISSELSEALVGRLRDKATARFFSQADENSLYYASGVRDKIQMNFMAELTALPEGAMNVRLGKWLIGKPRFVERARQTVHWLSTVTVNLVAYNETPTLEWPTMEDVWQSGVAGITVTGQDLGAVPPATTHAPFAWSGKASDMKWSIREELVAHGVAIFEVAWSTAFDDETLGAASLNDISYLRTEWAEV